MAYRTSGVQFMLVTKIHERIEYEAFFQSVIERFTRFWQTDTCTAELRAVFADIHSPEHAANVDEVIASLEYATRLAKEDPNGKPVRFSDRLRSQFARRNYVIAQMEKHFGTICSSSTFNRCTTSGSNVSRAARCCFA